MPKQGGLLYSGRWIQKVGFINYDRSHADSRPEAHMTWVGQWMTDLLKQDSDYVSVVKPITNATLIHVSDRSLTYESLSPEITLLKAQNSVRLVEGVNTAV
jgi:hypothetical protein